ncbi:MAG: hypothetical protein ACFFFC_08150 [Candidatus Thorarchaeota archaeon]
MVKLIEIKHDWAIWVDADSFETCQTKNRAPIHSIVIMKTKEAPKGESCYIKTAYGIVGEFGIVGINKKSASEILSNRAIDFIQRTGHWPPCTNLKRVLKSGDVELSFTITEHDGFTLRVTADMADGNPLDFLLGLNQYEKPKTSQRGSNQLIST